jgi:hypothetical protein
VRELGIKSEDLDGIVRHALEAAKNHLGLDGNNLVGRTRKLALESAHGSLDFFNLLDHLGSAGGTTRGRSLGFLSHEIYGPSTDIGETFHALQFGVQVNVLGEPVLAGNVERGTVDANTVEGLDGEIKELVEVDGSGKSNVSEMSLALKIRVFAGRADLTALDNTEPGIKDTAGNRVICLMGLVGNNFDDGSPEDLFRRSDPKLNAYNGHCILIRLSRNIFLRSVLYECFWVMNNDVPGRQ